MEQGFDPSQTEKKPQSTISAGIESKSKLDYRMVKEAGFKCMYYFMLSHNLKMYKDGDLRQAKQILQAFREIDQG